MKKFCIHLKLTVKTNIKNQLLTFRTNVLYSLRCQVGAKLSSVQAREVQAKVNNIHSNNVNATCCWWCHQCEVNDLRNTRWNH